MHAEITRQLQEKHKQDFGFILLMAGKASIRCKCGKLSCTACGFTKFHQRIRKIENGKQAPLGLMVGRPPSPSLL